jgi:hypothetical protein
MILIPLSISQLTAHLFGVANVPLIPRALPLSLTYILLCTFIHFESSRKIVESYFQHFDLLVFGPNTGHSDTFFITAFYTYRHMAIYIFIKVHGRFLSLSSFTTVEEVAI